MKLYTDSKIEISKFIEQNRTMLINSRKEAEEITKYRGYFYEIYDENKNFLCYGIPK